MKIANISQSQTFNGKMLVTTGRMSSISEKSSLHNILEITTTQEQDKLIKTVFDAVASPWHFLTPLNEMTSLNLSAKLRKITGQDFSFMTKQQDKIVISENNILYCDRLNTKDSITMIEFSDLLG